MAIGKRDERDAQLRAVLREVHVAEHWQEYGPSRFIDVAVRRWTSSERRIRPGKRTPERQTQDLLQGLKELWSCSYVSGIEP